MTPLAPWTYGLRNRARLIPQLAVTVLVVSAVILLLGVLHGLRATSLFYIREYRVYSILRVRGHGPPSAAVIRDLAGHRSVERVLRIRWMAFPVQTPVGPWKTSASAVSAADLPWLVARLGDRVAAGRLPRPGTNEVAVHERYARINGWRLGTELGRGVDPDRYPAPAGRFVVVGLLRGPTPTAVFSHEYVTDLLRYPAGLLGQDVLLVVAHPGRSDEMNARLRAHPERLALFDHAFMKGIAEQVFGPFLTGLRVLSLLLIGVSLLLMGLLSHLEFRRRMDELAVLVVLGHTRGALVRRSTLESLGLLLVGWLVGVAGAQGLLLALRRLVMEPHGYVLPLGQPEPILVSLALPAAGVLVGTWLTFRRLGRLDPIRVIERRR